MTPAPYGRTHSPRDAGHPPRYTAPVNGDADRRSKAIGWLLVLVSAAACALFARHALVVGSFPGRWVYPYVSLLRWGALLASLAAGAAAALLLAGALQVARRSLAAAALLLLGGGTALQLLLWRLSPFALGAIVRSDAATSYFSAATRYDTATLLRGYEAIAPRLPLHAQGNMPGKYLIFRAMHVFTSSPEAMAVAILLLANLVGVLVLLVALEVLEDREAAVGAMALYVLLPPRLVFAPILNGVAPLPVMLALWLWIRYLRGRSQGLAIAAGLALLMGLLLDPTPFGLGLVFLAVAVADRAAGRTGTARIATGSVVAAVTVVAGALLLQITTGFDTFRQLGRVTAEAARFNEWAGRPYATWVVANLAEFFLTLGAPVVVAVGWGLALRRSLRDPATWMGAVGLASVVAVDLLGRNRGEVTRLWIFLAVPFAISAAGFLRGAGRAPMFLAAAALVVQGGIMLSVLGFVIP